MAYDWLEEYAMHASSAKQRGLHLAHLGQSTFIGINWLLDREKQPHSDFFTNLSIDFEEELDFK